MVVINKIITIMLICFSYSLASKVTAPNDDTYILDEIFKLDECLHDCEEIMYCYESSRSNLIMYYNSKYEINTCKGRAANNLMSSSRLNEIGKYCNKNIIQKNLKNNEDKSLLNCLFNNSDHQHVYCGTKYKSQIRKNGIMSERYWGHYQKKWIKKSFDE